MEYHLPSWLPLLYLVSLSPCFFHIDSLWPWGNFSSSSSVSVWYEWNRQPQGQKADSVCVFVPVGGRGGWRVTA